MISMQDFMENLDHNIRQTLTQLADESGQVNLSLVGFARIALSVMIAMFRRMDVSEADVLVIVRGALDEYTRQEDNKPKIIVS